MNNCTCSLYYAEVTWDNDDLNEPPNHDRLFVQANSYFEAIKRVEDAFNNIISIKIEIISYMTDVGVFYLPIQFSDEIIEDLKGVNAY